MEETPTGITIADLADLDHAEKLALARWHERKCGWDAGLPFFGRVVRDLPVASRLALALDPDADRAWEVRERRRVRADVAYFVAGYGSVQPEEGPAIPFDLWPEQIDVLAEFAAGLRVIVLKARQLGLTWIALHYGFWRMAFDPASAKFRVLALSKKGGDADELIRRTRNLNDRLPPFLRQIEDADSRGSNSRFLLKRRGSEMRSLMGTPEAARSFTAGLAILDELAFYRHGTAPAILAAVIPTLGERGKAFAITTGNGTTGDGAAAATTWNQARSQTGPWHPIFLRYDVHPARRGAGWRTEKRKEFLLDEDFEAEFPETEEQALAGKGAYNVYPHAGIAAAMKLGRDLDPLLGELVTEGVEWGIDWGDFQTFAVYAIGLPRGGLFVIDELMLPHVEPQKASERIIYRDPAGIPRVSFTASRADAAPAGTNRTFGRVLREAWQADPYRYPEKHWKVDFSLYKEGGQKADGVNTVAYLRHLLDAAEEWEGPAEEASGVLAISPRCQTLASQMRNLERDAETGKVKKPALDPRHIERGDHGPDALVALSSTRAAKWNVEVLAA